MFLFIYIFLAIHTVDNHAYLAVGHSVRCKRLAITRLAAVRPDDHVAISLLYGGCLRPNGKAQKSKNF